MTDEFHLHGEWEIKVFPSWIPTAASFGIVGKLEILRDRVRAVARDVGLSPSEVEAIIPHIPDCILNAPCFFDRLSATWRYEYGDCYDVEQTRIIGTNVFPCVGRLILALHMAVSHIPHNKLKLYWQRIEDKKQHLFALAEMQPIMYMAGDIETDFEVSIVDYTKKTVDWKIKKPNFPLVFIEVKYRIADLIQGLGRIAKLRRSVEPDHNAELLFRSVQDKFPNTPAGEVLHGVWVVTEVKQNIEAVRLAFQAIDTRRVHFCVLSNWNRTGFVMTRCGLRDTAIADFFGIVNDPQKHVFTPGDSI